MIENDLYNHKLLYMVTLLHVEHLNIYIEVNYDKVLFYAHVL